MCCGIEVQRSRRAADSWDMGMEALNNLGMRIQRRTHNHNNLNSSYNKDDRSVTHN